MKTPFEIAGKLSVQGTQLVDQNGNPFQLRGISTHGLGWFPEYVNKDAFQIFRDKWGANGMRLAMYTGEDAGYCTVTGEARQTIKETAMRGVDACTELGMYVIVDWHILSDNNPMYHLAEAKEFFQEISSKYSNNDNIIYEICNEPNGDTNWDDIREYADVIIPIIKKNNPEAIIIVGTPTWSQEVDKPAANPITGYTNLMYTLHFYADTHRENLRNGLVEAKKAGVPIMVTEFGICDASGNGANNLEEGQKWIDLMDQEQVSYFIWNLSNKDESSALLVKDCTKAKDWEPEDISQAGKWYQKILADRRLKICNF